MIREIEKKDYQEAGQLLKEAFKEPPWNEEWTIENAICRVEELMDCRSGKGFVFLKENKIIGVLLGRIATYVNSKQLFIEEFFIDGDYRGLKIGSQMLEYCKKNLTMIDSIVLLTGNGFPSQSFYEKNGFVKDNDIIYMYYKGFQ